MFRSAILIVSGNAVTALLLFARNLIIARFISVENFGIASTFAVVMAFLEMVSSFGLQQQIVQSEKGDDSLFQSSLQGFQVIRGFVSGAVLFLVARPLATILEIPDVAWAYQVLAVVPIIKSFEHLDSYRQTRSLQFVSMVFVSTAPAVLSFILVWLFLFLYSDWRAMLLSILFQALLVTVASHLVAQRRYRLGFDFDLLKASLRFGFPILANSILMFGAFQGDKFVVAFTLGMEELGIFALGVTMTLTPTLLIAKSTSNFFLPLLSSSVGSRKFDDLAYQVLEVVSFAALWFSLLVLIFGSSFLNLFFGDKYVGLEQIFLWLAMAQTLRVCKAGPAIVALSLGVTSNALISNISRVLFLPLAFVIALSTKSLTWIVLIMLFGELCAFLVSFFLLLRISQLEVKKVLCPQLLSSGLLVLAALIFSAEANFQGFSAFSDFILAFVCVCLTPLLLPSYWTRMLAKRRSNGI